MVEKKDPEGGLWKGHSIAVLVLGRKGEKKVIGNVPNLKLANETATRREGKSERRRGYKKRKKGKVRKRNTS